MGTRIRLGMNEAVTKSDFVAAIEQTGWTSAVPSEYFSDEELI